MTEKDKLAELHDFLKYDVEVSFLDGDVIDVAMDVISKHIERIKELEKQNKRYREALEEILNLRNNTYPTEYVIRAESIARKALQSD